MLFRSSEPIGAVNGGYEVELNKNMQGENAPGFAVLKVDAPQAPAGENKAYQIRVMQHINLSWLRFTMPSLFGTTSFSRSFFYTAEN